MVRSLALGLVLATGAETEDAERDDSRSSDAPSRYF